MCSHPHTKFFVALSNSGMSSNIFICFGFSTYSTLLQRYNNGTVILTMFQCVISRTNTFLHVTATSLLETDMGTISIPSSLVNDKGHVGLGLCVSTNSKFV